MSEKLKINFLTAYSHIQGTYFRWHNIGVGLISYGHEVTVYCVDYSDNAVSRVEMVDGLEYHFIKSAMGKQYLGTINNPFTAINRLFVNYKKCDILHIFQPFLSIYLPWKFKLKYLAKVTIFDWDDLWVGGMYSENNKEFVNKWNHALTGYFEKKIPSLQLPMTTCSKLLRDLATERGNKDCTIFHNGYWPYQIEEKAAARIKMKLQPNCIYVGFMGRTTHELSWCFEALELCLQQNLSIRFALCGPNKEELNNMPELAMQHTDYLGNLTPLETRDFAAALDLGLLPLDDNTFNRSRFPIKLSEYMAAGIPVLCSEVGEMKKYIDLYPWVINAGTDKQQWISSFLSTINNLLASPQLFKVDKEEIKKDLSWFEISNQLESFYFSKLELA